MLEAEFILAFTVCNTLNQIADLNNEFSEEGATLVIETADNFLDKAKVILNGQTRKEEN